MEQFIKKPQQRNSRGTDGYTGFLFIAAFQFLQPSGIPQAAYEQQLARVDMYTRIMEGKAQADRVKDEWRAMAPPDTNAQDASDREQRPEIRRPAEPKPEVIQPAREIQPEILDPAGGPELGTPENRPDQSQPASPQPEQSQSSLPRQSEEGLENAEVRAVQAGVEEIAQAEALEARKRQSGKDRLQKEAKAARAKAGKGEDEVSKEVRIREILEEFLA